MANKNFRVRHGLTVSGNAKASGNLSVQGGTLLSGAVQAKTNVSVGQALTVSGMTSLQGGLVVDTSMDVQTKLNANDISSSGALTVQGTAYLSGAVQAKGNLSVGGSTILSGDVQAKSDISVGGKAIVGGSTICTSAILASNVSTQFLQVSGNASIGGTLVVTTVDATNIQASGVLSGAQIRGTSLAVTTVDAAGTLQVSGNASIGGTLNLNSTLAVSTGTLLPNIQVKGVGPNLIRFHDSGTTSVTNALDLVYRATENTLGFEKASDETKIWETDFDTLTTTFHEPLTVSGALKAAGLTCLQAGAVVTQGLQLKNELNFDGASEKYMDFALVSSDTTQFSANFRSFDANNQNFHTHIKFTRAGGVELYNNGNKKMETNGSGIYVSGAVSAHTNVYAGQQLRAGGALSVAGDVRGKGLLQISGTASIGGQIQGGGNISAAQQLKAGGSVSVAGNLIAKQGLQVSGSASVGSIKVTGTTQLQGGVSVGGSGTIAGVSFDKGHLRIGSATAGIAMDPNEIYFSGAGNFGTLSGNLAINPAGSITTGKTFDSTGNIVTEGTLSATTIRGVSLAVTTVDCGGVQSSGAVSCGSLHSAGGGQFNGTVSVTSLYSSGQVRAAGALSCAGTGHFSQGIQVSGTVSCTALHATGGQVQTTGNVSGGNLLTGGIVRAGGQICNALQIFSQQTVVARKNLHVSGTACVGGNSKFVGAMSVCGKLTGTQISCHRILSQSGNINSGGADFAEYFEWADGNPNVSDRIGRSVAITGPSGKIGIATAGQIPFGVITGRPGFIGAAAHGEWAHKWLRDDYFRIQRDENGEKILNPEWNSACTYMNRESRKEWAKVGLLGKLAVRVGETVNPNWTKMRVVTATIEEYLVR